MEQRPTDPPGFAAVVELCGEHDLATGGDLRAALDPLHGNVLVDLSSCEFIDSTVIGVLPASASSRKQEGHHLELLVLKGSNVLRTLEITGVPALVAVRIADRTTESTRTA